MKLTFVIDLSDFAPVVRPLCGFGATVAARLLRLHASQLHPMAPAAMHRSIALRLANLERRI